MIPEPEAPYPAYMLTGAFVRDTTRLGLNEPALILGSGFIVTTHTVSPLETPGGFWWAANLRRHAPMRIPREKADEVLAEVLSEPALPPLDVPDELRFDEPDATPVPVLTLRPESVTRRRLRGHARVRLRRGARGARRGRPAQSIALHRDRFIRRKREVETAAEETLKAHRVGSSAWGWAAHLSVPFKTVPAMVRDLLPQGWRIDVEGKPFRVSGDTAVEVTSEIDWFDVGGMVDFDGVPAPLPELLAAVRRGESTVVLPDRYRRPHRLVDRAVRRALGVCRRRRGPPPRARVTARPRRCPACVVQGRDVGRPRPRGAQQAARLRGDCGRRRAGVLRRHAARIPAARARLAAVPAGAGTWRMSPTTWASARR